MIKDFTDLTVWQASMELAITVYKTTQEFPKEERFVLIDQMRRAVISISSNIAEGFGSSTGKQKLKYYYTARGSATELESQIRVAQPLGLMPTNLYENLLKECTTTLKLINGIIRSTKKYSQ